MDVAKARYRIRNPEPPSVPAEPPLKILMLAAEAAPFAKTGGLGDVAGSLPKALAALGHDVRVVMPAYGSIERAAAEGRDGIEPIPGSLAVPMGSGSIPAGMFGATLPGCTVPVRFIAHREILGRDRVYGYDDDPYRFAFFARATLELAAAWGFLPDVVHAHDWHAAPAVAWLSTTGTLDDRFRTVPSVYTIHNLAHQGRAGRELLAYLGMDSPRLVEEAPGEVNFMARGIYHATMINTVSETYAREIQGPELGVGLDRLLRFRSFDVHGIVNGLDHDEWNPATDRRLARPFDAARLADRAENKRSLQARLGLPVREDAPLLAMVSRLDAQKGMDLMGHAVHLLLEGQAGGDAQFVVLGTGAAAYEAMFARLADHHRDRMRAILAYAGDVAPLLYAGADAFLMPSRFEPCGLGQLIAMRYGCVPIVRATGGLADTVHDGVTGFVFQDYHADAFFGAIARALSIWRHDRPAWTELQRRGMALDTSWRHSAQGYVRLYRWAISRMRGW